MFKKLKQHLMDKLAKITGIALVLGIAVMLGMGWA